MAKKTPSTTAEQPELLTARRDDSLTLEVKPRKPRLAWQGMDRKEVAVSVPTQVVEIVRPGLAQERGGNLSIDVRRSTERDADVQPNRLIWTNDNLVALQTLLDEKDEHGDYRYRGKVDLIYIDPPFMVNNDFMADNAIDIDLGDNVQVQKEPSLVEILAYKDTWRQGLDSFLTMLRSRLVLLKELLAPTGSIYVHLDWHAVHYVKVMMDELFGYENFASEIIWQRIRSSKGQSNSFGTVHDTLLVYGRTASAWHCQQYTPLDPERVKQHYSNMEPDTKFRYMLDNFTQEGDGPPRRFGDRVISPPNGKHWIWEQERIDDEWGKRVVFNSRGNPRVKRYLHESNGNPMEDIWTDIPPVNSQAAERLGYPTQKPVALVERIIFASCPPDGLVLDCFNGSGTTSEAAERLGRRWIGIDNGKYAIHLARKRLIQLHDKPRPPEAIQYEYPECEKCGKIELKQKKQRNSGSFDVRPFTVENMGVYQRAEEWQDFQKNRSVYRDAMVQVFGAVVSDTDPLLHGLKNKRTWVHVGPLDAPISTYQIHAIARAAAKTEVKSVDILSADFNTLAASDKEDIARTQGVNVTVRIIPKSAIDEVRRRVERKLGEGEIVESMAIPAFYAPLSIELAAKATGLKVEVTLKRCEVDIESFLTSQREPLFKNHVYEAKTDAQKKKLQASQKKWDAREKVLREWLNKADSWKKFVDFWAVDSDYQSRLGDDNKPVFETEWQSFRERRGRGVTSELSLTAEFSYESPGTYQIAARVTDVFGNDGIATIEVRVG